MPLPTSHVFIVPSSPTSGHRTLKLDGLIHGEHATMTTRGTWTLRATSLTKPRPLRTWSSGGSGSRGNPFSTDGGARTLLWSRRCRLSKRWEDMRGISSKPPQVCGSQNRRHDVRTDTHSVRIKSSLATSPASATAVADTQAGPVERAIRRCTGHHSTPSAHASTGRPSCESPTVTG
jgi:hypothetical protein